MRRIKNHSFETEKVWKIDEKASRGYDIYERDIKKSAIRKEMEENSF